MKLNLFTFEISILGSIENERLCISQTPTARAGIQLSIRKSSSLRQNHFLYKELNPKSSITFPTFNNKRINFIQLLRIGSPLTHYAFSISSSSSISFVFAKTRYIHSLLTKLMLKQGTCNLCSCKIFIAHHEIFSIPLSIIYKICYRTTLHFLPNALLLT